LCAAGGEAEIEIWPEMWHVFQLFIGKMPEARRAIHKIGDFVRERTATRAESEPRLLL